MAVLVQAVLVNTVMVIAVLVHALLVQAVLVHAAQVLAVLVQCPQARSVLRQLDEVLLNLPRGLPQDLPMEPLWLLELRMMTAIQIGPQLASLLLPWA